MTLSIITLYTKREGYFTKDLVFQLFIIYYLSQFDRRSIFLINYYYPDQSFVKPEPTDFYRTKVPYAHIFVPVHCIDEYVSTDDKSCFSRAYRLRGTSNTQG